MKESHYKCDVFRATGGENYIKSFLLKQELRFLFYCRKIDEKGLLTPIYKFLRKRISNRTGLEIDTKISVRAYIWGIHFASRLIQTAKLEKM